MAPATETVSPAPPESSGPARSVLKAVSAGLVMLALASLIARAFLTWVNETTPRGVRWVSTMDTDRVASIRDALPALAAKDEPVALMLGPSASFYGFIPDAFDASMRAHGVEVVSYNLGTLGNISATDHLLVRRIGEAFATAGRRPKLIILPFAPLAATLGFLEGRKRSHERKKALLSTRSELAQLFWRDPHQATELATLQLFGGIGPTDTNSLIGKRIFSAPSWWFLSPDWELGEWEQQSAIVNAGYRSQLGKFDLATRGVFNPLLGNTVADYDRMAELAFTPENLKKQFGFWGSAGFEDVEIDDERLSTFVLAVQEAQQIADAVVVVVPPNSEHVRPGATGRQNIATALDKIRADTGVPLLDLSDTGAFEQADFVDFTHLKHNTGAPKYSRMLADAVAPLLATPR